MSIKNKKQLAGVILAGGESKRFGTPKAFVKYQEKYFFEHSIEALAPFTDKLIVVSHPSFTDRFSYRSLMKVLEDLAPYRGNGPLSGLYSVMKQVEAEWYIVLPCDMPLITAKVISQLIEAADETVDAVIPVISGKIHPLVAVYHQRVLPVLTEQLANGDYRMMDVIRKLNVKEITEADLPSAKRLFKNINTKDAYIQLFTGESCHPLK